MNYFTVGRTFLAGAGLLMFGLYLFEEAVKALGGRQLKRLLEAQTKTLWKGMRAGTWISALTTSSTFVSLLLVAFVGAGLLGLHNAIGVILGANIGTTINSLWVAYMGFGEFKIAKYALPLIAVGGVIHMVTKNKTGLHVAHICIGIGLLFVGLDFMKESVETIAQRIDLTNYHNLRAFGGIGLLITALLHSQAAMQIITLAALNGGIITLPAAFAIIIGANIGTTMTALTASLGGSIAHKQVALAHFFQNLIAACFGIIFFHQFVRLTSEWLAGYLGYEDNHVLATAWFNTLFNIFTALPFICFPHLFARSISRLTPQKDDGKESFLIEKFKSISDANQTIGIQLNALLSDCATLKKRLQGYIFMVSNSSYNQKQNTNEQKVWTEEERLQGYHRLKQNIDFLYNTLLPLHEANLTRSDVSKINKITALLELTTDTAKAFKSISMNLQELRHTQATSYKELAEHIDKQIQTLIINDSPEPPLVDIQERFTDIINQTKHDDIREIDIPTLISTQHGLSQAYIHYRKLCDLMHASYA